MRDRLEVRKNKFGWVNKIVREADGEIVLELVTAHTSSANHANAAKFVDEYNALLYELGQRTPHFSVLGVVDTSDTRIICAAHETISELKLQVEELTHDLQGRN